MKAQGIITKTDGDKARVAVTTNVECAGCASKGHCGMGDNRPREITVINTCGAEMHDLVEFEAETGKVILSAALIWILPVISMILGYIVADRFASGVVPILAAFSFLALSYLILKAVDTMITGGSTFYPRISSILNAETPKTHCDINS